MVTQSLYFKKLDKCHNSSNKLSTTKVNKHTAWKYSLFTQCSFDCDRNKHDYYRCKYFMKNFCKD